MNYSNVDTEFVDEMVYDNVERFPLFDKVRNNHDIRVYIEEQNKTVHAMGFTEHSHPHVEIVKNRVGYILSTLGYDDHTVDLGLCAAWMHDIGNVVNRVNHSQTGALMAFNISALSAISFSAGSTPVFSLSFFSKSAVS